MEELSIKTIKDVNGNMYVLDSILGQGGQGMVCKTKDSTIAVKFVLKNEQILTDEKYYEIYKNKINDVVVMNIDSDINLCHPYTMLEKPYCGYVMHMLSDLKPISNLIYDQNIDGNLNDYFRNTNGLKKRIEVLIELSRTLARLHSKGIVYCDISPNNVFYSDIDNFSKVWIIDCDNLKYTGDVKSGIFTPGFGAPEVASNQSSNTIFSDCFSFAVLAFRVLTFRNPFEVNYEEESSSDGWDASTNTNNSGDAISNNNIPWLFENGVTDELKEYFNHFLTKELLSLFNQTFGKDGRNIPTSRPSMREWYSVLKELSLKLNLCECGAFIYAGEKICPFCNKGPRFTYYGTMMNYYPKSVDAIGDVKSQLNNDDYDDLDFINEVVDKKISPNYEKLYNFTIYDNCRIYNYSVNQISIYEVPYTLIEFRINNSYLFINNKSSKNISYIYKGEKGTLLSGDNMHISGKDAMYLYINDPDSKIIHCIMIKGI
ncbi:protein kinase domain-containing protein [Anaeroplasma bactoclasticum]|jgi:serine/threonine protein kinase|nr:hypothetical protein [Anaeroplasma bactoclasticum]